MEDMAGKYMMETDHGSQQYPKRYFSNFFIARLEFNRRARLRLCGYCGKILGEGCKRQIGELCPDDMKPLTRSVL